MASNTVSKARPGERVKIGTRLYEYGRTDGTNCSYYADLEMDEGGAKKQRRVKLAATTRTAARVEQQNLNSDKNRNLVAAPSKVTLSEVAESWLEGLDVKPRSRESYDYHLRINILPQLGAREVQSIRPRDCTSLVRWLASERKVSVGTQVAAFRVLDAVLEHAVQEEILHANPLRRVKRPAKTKAQQAESTKHRYLTPSEIERLLAHSNGYRPVFELAVWTGLRQSEVLGLVWSDIDLTTGTISVSKQLSRASRIEHAERVSTKTGSGRMVNIDSELVALLRGLKEDALGQGRAQPESYVFQTREGNPLSYRNVGKAFDQAAERAGLNPEGGRRLRFHDLRRTFASVLLNAGQPAPYVAKQLGHTVQVLYSTYAGLLEAQEGEQRERHLEAVQAFRSGA